MRISRISGKEVVLEIFGKGLRIVVLPALALTGIPTARADEPVFGFIYMTDLLPKGQKDIEQWLT
jgi:hypothetical protein